MPHNVSVSHNSLFARAASRGPIWLLKAVLIALLFFTLTYFPGRLLAEETISVNEADGVRAATTKVEPSYPAMAKQMRISGRVQVTANVDADGNVDKVEVENGNAILANACVNAVKRWRFSPFQSGGKAAKAHVHLSFSFNMQ